MHRLNGTYCAPMIFFTSQHSSWRGKTGKYFVLCSCFNQQLRAHHLGHHLIRYFILNEPFALPLHDPMIALEVVTFVVYDNVSDLTYHYLVNSGCPGLRKVNWYSLCRIDGLAIFNS